MDKTHIDEVLPVTLTGPGEVVQERPAVLLGPTAGVAYPDSPALFWRHDVELRPGAEPLAFAGSHVVAAQRRAGKGGVIVFAGTVLGEGVPADRPFWECRSWMALAKRMVASDWRTVP